MEALVYESPYDYKPLSPSVKVEEESGNYGRFEVAPLERGWGNTLGNSLRRVLLSSLIGAAVTAVRLEDVYHEFTSLPGVKEQVLDFLLNVKGIRIRALGQRPGRLRLEVRGQGEVTAGDIRNTSDFEVVNPEHHLAFLTDNDAELAAEFEVNLGFGYKKAASDVDSMPAGFMPLDAVFTPIKRVAYRTESTTIEKHTDCEKLILEIWTDGAITPEQALKKLEALGTEKVRT